MTISAEAKNAVTESRLGGWLLVILVAVMLAGLPLAVWLDLSNLSRTALSRQAEDLSSVITGIRGYYATNVVGRILASHGKDTKLAHNYEQIPGAIPIPRRWNTPLIVKRLTASEHTARLVENADYFFGDIDAA